MGKKNPVLTSGQGAEKMVLFRCIQICHNQSPVFWLRLKIPAFDDKRKIPAKRFGIMCAFCIMEYFQTGIRATTYTGQYFSVDWTGAFQFADFQKVKQLIPTLRICLSRSYPIDLHYLCCLRCLQQYFAGWIIPMYCYIQINYVIVCAEISRSRKSFQVNTICYSSSSLS